MTHPYQTATLPRPSNAQQSRQIVQTATVKPACEKRGGRSAEASEYRRWYDLALWRRTLRPNQLTKEPLCRFCQIRGIVRAADTVDHIVPHRGVWALFSDPANLQSLDADCHRKAKAEIERLGFSTMTDADGYPIDPSHPANRQYPELR